MNLLGKITEKAFRAAGATAVREYEAAGRNRLVGDWTTQNNSANQEIKASIKQLRARGRQLGRDNDYWKGYLRKAETNVLGECGITLQANATKSDKSADEITNNKVEDEWQTWCRKENCDVTGQSDLRDVAALALKTLLTDGEFLIRLLNVDGTLKLQMLDVDWLDEDYNDDKLPSGNRVIMSVEVDQFDKPVAYWLSNPKWSNVMIPGMRIVPSSVRRIRVPAEQIMHRFLRDRIGQTRGVSSGHTAMKTLNQVDGFDEAELVAARINASNMAFISGPAEDGGAKYGSNRPAMEMEVEPGMVREIPPGYTVHEFSPNKPQDTDFSKRLLRKIATGLGISYSTLTTDLTEVNYSSIRAGTIDERDIWKVMQIWMAKYFYQDVYAKWLMFHASIVPVTKLKQVMYPVWRARGFDWVDPSKDINADILAINRGLKTMTDVLAERGKDFEQTMEQHKREKDFIEKLGLQFASPDLQAQIAADQADAQNSDTQDKPAKDKGKTKK
jgi:lambda family phage portal protein